MNQKGFNPLEIAKSINGDKVQPQKPRQRKSLTGFTLIEVLIYTAILAVISLLVVNMVLSLNTSFAKMRVRRNLSSQGRTALERMIRDIRLAYEVDSAASVFNSHPGRLELRTVVGPGQTATTSRTFFLVGQDLAMQEGISSPQLLSWGVKTTNLVFYLSNPGATSTSKLIRVELTIEAGAGRVQSQEKFSASALLRGSY